MRRKTFAEPRSTSLRRRHSSETRHYHCQQAVEKALKGFLTWHDRVFRKTHDLGELGGQCTELDPELESGLRRAAPLTEYAWRYRYPGEPFAPAETEVREALRVARETVAILLRRMPREAQP